MEESSGHTPSSNFKKRDGTTDRGREYEDLTIADMALYMTLDRDIEDFSIASNQKNFGSFDDIVLTVGPKTYAIQIKHSNKQNVKIKMAYFQNRYKMLNTLKESFNRACEPDLIFATNLTLKSSDEEILKISMPNGERRIELIGVEENQKPGKIFSDVHDCKRYKFELVEENQEAVEYLELVEKFSLYTNLASLEQVDAHIQKRFAKYKCGETACKNYLEFIHRWSNDQSHKTKLHKVLIRNSLALCLLSQHIIALPSRESTQINDKYELLMEAARQFKVTVFRFDKGDRLKIAWNEDKEEIEKLSHQYQIPNRSQEALNKLLWLANKIPLIVKNHDDVLEAIRLTENQKFIVLHGSETHVSLPDWFHVLDQLRAFPELYRKFLETYTLTLQGGEEYPLEKLIELDDEVSKLLTTDVLMDLCFSSLLGKKDEVVPVRYINRTLSKIIVNSKFLESNQNSLVILLSEDNIDQVRIRFNTINMVDLEEFLTGTALIGNVLHCNDASSLKILERQAKTYHLFREERNLMGLEWLKSTGNIKDLEEYRLPDGKIPDSSLLNYELWNNIIVICSGSGMGKTTLMKTFRCSNMWTLFIHLRTYSSHFAQNDGDEETFRKHVISKCASELESKMLKIFWEKGMIRYIWDGLDEVPEKNVSNVINVILKLSRTGSKHWITSREGLKERLEECFNVKCRSLRPFSKEEQRQFLHSLIDTNASNIVEDSLYRDLLENPLNITKVAKKIGKNLEEYMNQADNPFVALELIEFCIEEKYYDYHEQNNTDLIHKMLVDYKRYKFRDYEALAMKLQFNTDNFKKLNLDHYLDESESDVIGIVDTIDGSLTFSQESFRNYFVASYMAKHPDSIFHLKKELFGENQANIRLLFDAMLVKDHPAHVAVLRKDLEALQICTKEQLNEKDKIGRTPLHLACCWGLKFPNLLMKQTTAGYLIDDKIVRAVPKCTTLTQQILKHLWPEFDPNETSFIPRMLTECGHSLLPFALLPEAGTLKEVQILYYSVLFDCVDMFDMVVQVPKVETKVHGSLLDMANSLQSVNCAKKLSAIEHYRENVECDV